MIRSGLAPVVRSACAAGFLVVMFAACGSGVGSGPGDGSEGPDAAPLAGDDASATADGGGGMCGSGILCGSPAVCCDEGQECQQGACVAACESGVRCDGACCASGEVCLDAMCAARGAACGDSFDCPEGHFCEPTIDECLPQPSGPLCEVRPDTVEFEPLAEWQWTGWSEDARYHNIAVAPSIADIDADGTPEAAFAAYRGGDDTDVMLVVVSGDGGAEELAIPSSELRLARWSGVATGNLDGDVELEMVVLARELGVVALEHDGAIKWDQAAGSLGGFADSSATYGYPSLANLDGDPAPEVVIGGVWLDDDGTVLQDEGLIGCNSDWCMSAVADIDGDGTGDIVGGDRVYRADGQLVWDSPEAVGDGFPAVADMNGDGQADVVTVSDGDVFVLDGADGTFIFEPVPIPGGGNGGAPTIADFDGDGQPEFSSAGRGFYTVYDLDCRESGGPGECATGRTDGILWEHETQDISSSVTGSSVFDFEGDGSAEVVYNDECTLYVLAGTDGTELLARPNTSRTAAEYPLVADVDADGNSEFMVPANRDQIGRDGCDPDTATQGLFAYGDTFDQWVRTRPVWNQHTYHVTNVRPDGEIPANEDDNWSVTGLNNYRQNVQGEGIFNAADLVVLGVGLDVSGCPDTVDIEARIGNEGSLGVPAGAEVAFYLGTPEDGTLLGTRETTRALLPGESETVRWTHELESGDSGPWDFTVVVDEESAGGVSAVTECAEGNNDDSVDSGGCVIIE